MPEETIYAVNIKVDDAASGTDGTDAAYLRQMAESLSRIERVTTKNALIGGAIGGGLGGSLGSIISSLGTGILGAAGIGTNAGLNSSVNAQRAQNEREAAIINGEYEIADVKERIASIQEKIVRAQEDGILSAEEIIDLTQEQVGLQEEYNQLATYGQESVRQQKISQQELNSLLADAAGAIERINEVKKNTASITQANISAIQAETAAYKQQLNTLIAIEKRRESVSTKRLGGTRDRVSADVFRGSENLGEFEGYSFSAAESRRLGYGNQDTFVGVRTVR